MTFQKTISAWCLYWLLGPLLWADDTHCCNFQIRSFESRYKKYSCHGDHIRDGWLTTPGYPSQYPNNARCMWTLKAESGQYLHLQIFDFSTENVDDFLQVRDDKGVIQRYYGSQAFRQLSVGSHATVSFSSDDSTTNRGFEIFVWSYPYSCGGPLFESGVIQSPGYPGSYPNHANCTWSVVPIINQDGSSRVRLQFLDFSTEYGQDVLEVYFYEGNGRRKHRFSGSSLPATLVVQGVVDVSFTSNRIVSGAGFKILFTTTNLACGSDLSGSGFLRSHRNPTRSSGETQCMWTLSATPPSRHIRLQFLELSMPGQFDFLQISDLTGASHRFFESGRPANLLVTSPAIVQFYTNESIIRTDFNLLFTTSMHSCGSELFGSGVLQSPGYPSAYPNNADCTWTVQASQDGHYIRLKFLAFSTENNWDLVVIRGGDDAVQRFSGSSVPADVLLLSPASISFISDGSGGSTGFQAMFTTIRSSCGENLVGSGVLQSPGYPLPYPNNADCMWTIQASRGGTYIRLQFLAFSTEVGWDLVMIRGGDGEVQKLSGSSLPADRTLRSPVRVSFKSDQSVARTGFRILFTTATYSCGGELTTSGVLVTPGHPGYYPNNANCTWTLRTPFFGYLYVQFLAFSTEEIHDYVLIRDESGVSYRFSGSNIPANFSIGSPATVSFASDSFIANTGFMMSFSTETNYWCGGNLSGSGDIQTPGHPGRYPNSAKCTWTLTAVPTGYIYLQFLAFATEERFDILEIRDEEGVEYRFSGMTRPESVSISRRATVSFTSDHAVAYSGFKISFTSSRQYLCGGELVGCGLIQSPDHPGMYPNNANCTWTLRASPVGQVHLQFLAFSTENAFDFVQIVDGTGLSRRFSGSSIPANVSVGSPAVLSFISDYTNSRTGFQVLFSTATVHTQPKSPSDFDIDISFPCFDVTFTSEGHILLAAGLFGLKEYSRNGSQLTGWIPEADAYGRNESVTAVDVLPDGNVVIILQRSRFLLLLTRSENGYGWREDKRISFGCGLEKIAAVSSNHIALSAVDCSSNSSLAQMGSRLLTIDPNRQLVTYMQNVSCNVISLASVNNSIFAAEDCNGTSVIERFTTQGDRIWQHMIDGSAYLSDIAADPSGRLLYLASTPPGTVRAISTNGRQTVLDFLQYPNGTWPLFVASTWKGNSTKLGVLKTDQSSSQKLSVYTITGLRSNSDQIPPGLTEH